MLDEPTIWPGYSILSNNCESFATLLKTDKHVSAQAEEATVRIVAISGSVVLGSICALAYSGATAQTKSR